MDLYPDELIAFLTDCASRAETLRQLQTDQEVVLILGCELSLFCKGFVPGETSSERIAVMSDPATWTDPAKLQELQSGMARWAEVQNRLVAEVSEGVQRPDHLRGRDVGGRRLESLRHRRRRRLPGRAERGDLRR